MPDPLKGYHFLAGVLAQELAPKEGVGDADAKGQEGEDQEDGHDPNRNILPTKRKALAKEMAAALLLALVGALVPALGPLHEDASS